MDLGATLCTRRNPECAACPLHDDCAARVAGRQHELPGKKPKKTRPLKNTRMVLAHADGSIYLERRPPAGIWGGLWSLPELGDGDAVEDWCEQHLAARPQDTNYWTPLRHSFSHFDLDIQPIAVRIGRASSKVADADGRRWWQPGEAPQIGLAAPVQKLIDTLLNAGEHS